jgi:hypothetical protein
MGVWACYNAPVETPAPKTTQESDVRVAQNVKNKVDILFMVDNSPSMLPKQAELQARFPLLIKILNDFGKTNPAWYHVGVVTSDLGAGAFTLGGGQCHPGGDGAKLQAVGANAAMGCTPPGGGLNFIDYNQIANTSNLPSGTASDPNLELETQFSCMSSVGAAGCGFEMQLESVYRALHDPIATNQGFLRSDALLVIVLVTDEDDCSADPNTDLFDPSKIQPPPNGYGALLSYRCTNYSIACPSLQTPGNLLPYSDSGGNQVPCQDADPMFNKLIPVSKYINYFTESNGGVKVDPTDVIFVDITAPDDTVESILANPSTMPPGPYQTCTGPVDGQKCAVVLNHSCVSPQNNAFFGDPAVRIRQVAKSVTHNQSTSICDTSYQSALQSLGQLIISNIGAGCINSPFSDPANPDCIVELIQQVANSNVPKITEVPRCDQVNNTPTCWSLDQKPVCGGATMQGCCDATKYSPAWPTPTVCAKDGDAGQSFGVSIHYPNNMVPDNTTARVACSTLAISPNAQTGQLPACM